MGRMASWEPLAEQHRLARLFKAKSAGRLNDRLDSFRLCGWEIWPMSDGGWQVALPAKIHGHGMTDHAPQETLLAAFQSAVLNRHKANDRSG